MKWFGEPWPSAEHRAPVCYDDADRVELPPGKECGDCGLPLKPDAQGVVIPYYGTKREVAPVFYHIRCISRMVSG